MTILRQLLKDTAEELMSAGISDAHLEAELLWMTALGVDRAHLYAELRTAVLCPTIERGLSLLSRRLRHEPTAYLTGRREFYGLNFRVEPGVFIPRPETETVVEEALRLLDRFPGNAVGVDVGTGSGAIAIALAVHRLSLTVHAIDSSMQALEVAACNAGEHGVAGRVHLFQSDLLEGLPERVDLVVANLPYIRTSDMPGLEPEVVCHEPREALDGGDDGLDVVRRLLDTAAPYLKQGALLLLELDPRQMEDASAHARHRLSPASIHALPDLAGRSRVLTIEMH